MALSPDGASTHHDITEFFDVKFYPYLAPTEDPIFAAVSKKHVRIDTLAHAHPHAPSLQ